MKNLLILLILFVSTTNLFSQAQLIQSFIEENIVGTSNFGRSVSTAGDVNNDGFDDVIVGADGYNSTGRAYIFYGSSSMDNTSDVTFNGEGGGFGYSVSSAGDVNNDGFDDVIVGASGYKSNTGRVYIYYGGSSMDNTADITLNGEDESYHFGISVSTAGDVNNDGFDDVIVGASGYPLSSRPGRAYIFYGSSSMDNTADVSFDAEGGDNSFGESVSMAGDVNNDGFDDVIVGAAGFNSNTGRVYFYYGGSSMDNTADVIFNGEGEFNFFGRSVSTAGDVNNDDYDDMIIGAGGYNKLTGRAYIFYGGSSMDNTVDVSFNGEAQNNNFGSSVSTAGDVNNDGFDDVIVGADQYNSWTGRAYIFYGDSSMDSTADVTFDGKAGGFGRSVSTAGDVNNDGYDDVIIGTEGYSLADIYYGSSSMDNTSDVTLNGEGEDNNFGRSVSTAGDVNNDGFDDVIVGADEYYYSAGRAYIYYGGSSMDNTADVTFDGEGGWFGYSVSTAGDVNNDGFDDVIVGAEGNNLTGRAYIYYGGSSMDNTADITLNGEGDYNYFGESVSSAGDVNDDGFDDVIVGAYGYNNSTGQTYIYYGGSSMDSTADVAFNGESEYNYFGRSVSTAGDVNNDGFDDVIVGASGYNSNTGRVYIYYGGSSMDNTADVTFNGEGYSNYFGRSVSTAGDVNNDGFDDVIVGADGHNNSIGRTYFYYGSSSMDNTADATFDGEGEYDHFGYSVFTAGDVNNDGFDDVIVGAYGYYLSAGRAYIYYGSSSMDNTADVTINGEGGGFGSSVSTAGDVNNDDYDDVIIGAYLNDSNGKAYIYSDPAAPVSVELTKLFPEEFTLLQNYPNPFNPSTKVGYRIPEQSFIKIEIINLLGQSVKVLVNREKQAGFHEATWNAENLPSGIYLISIKAEGLHSNKSFVQVKKALLLK